MTGGKATSSGGGMSISDASPAVTNCTFSGNSADTSGGGMYINTTETATVGNTILWGNTAGSGSDIYNNNGTVKLKKRTASPATRCSSPATRMGTPPPRTLTSAGTSWAQAARPSPGAWPWGRLWRRRAGCACDRAQDGSARLVAPRRGRISPARP